MCALERIEAVYGSTCADLCGSAARFSANWLLPKSPEASRSRTNCWMTMKAEFQEFPGGRVYTDVEREGIPPPDADKQPVVPRGVQEEEDRSLPPSLPELDSETHHSLREALQGENVPVPSDVSSHLDSDRSHRTASQNSRYQSWSMPPDVLSREMDENMQNVRALESVHPMNHPNVQRQLSEDSTPERKLSNQTRERTIARADEPPTQLDNPVPFVGQELMMIQGSGSLPRMWKMRKTCGPKRILRCDGSSKSTITSGRTMGNLPVCGKKSGMSSSAITSENRTAHVCFCRSELTGLTETRMTRGDVLPSTHDTRIRVATFSFRPRWQSGQPFWTLPLSRSSLRLQQKPCASICPTESFLRDMCDFELA